MRRRVVLVGGLVMGLAAPRITRSASPPVVLELFTSQGCSSCPPADALLGELAKRPDVIALAWHVDYWNNLGWKDPYASRQWTDRQRAYAQQLREDVYTPALVVNGAAMVIGSDRRAVTRAMAETPAPSVAVSLRRTPSGLEARSTAWPTGAAALLVTYDPENATAVGAGENVGRHLTEYRIVREARDIALANGPIALPPVQPRQGAALLIRDAAWRLLGAADLPPG